MSSEIRRLHHHVDGKAVPASADDRSIEVRAPATDQVVAEVPRGDPDVVESAVASARAALTLGVPAHTRAAVLDAVAARIASERDTWARLIAEEAGKPMRTARVEVDRCVSTLRFSAAEARTLSGAVVPMDASVAGTGKLAFTMRQPIGVLAAITPFNFPLNLVAHKLGPAVAAGTPFVLKPAEKTPSAGHHLALALEEAGLPPGFVNIVHGEGAIVVPPLVAHSAVDAVSFTGSAAVGRIVERLAVGKKVMLELGSNAALLVQPDADLARVAIAVRDGGFTHAGQSCVSVQRVLVHRDVHDALVEAIVAAVAPLVVGDPLDDDTQVGPLINELEAKRVERTLAEAVANGATLRLGGTRRGAYVQPAVLTDVDPDDPAVVNEIFGPAVAVMRYNDLADGIALANRSTMGLNAAIFTSNISDALTAFRELRVGAVLVNESPTYRTDQMPYGGVADSGDAREGPAWTVRDLTTEKLLIVQG
jgi:acyl-CoA reductase-like NAD-dependent aldehyde dehydrogenase